MLESMRQNVKSLQLFFWLVVVAFIGAPVVGALRGCFGKTDVRNAVGWVNGKSISSASFRLEFGNIYGLYKQLYGDNLTQDVLKNLQLEQMMLQYLQFDILWAHAFNFTNVYVSALAASVSRDILDA